jgi:hypothetical protein
LDNLEGRVAPVPVVVVLTHALIYTAWRVVWIIENGALDGISVNVEGWMILVVVEG